MNGKGTRLEIRRFKHKVTLATFSFSPLGNKANHFSKSCQINCKKLSKQLLSVKIVLKFLK